MEFFKQVDLDWMGKAKYFFALSLALLVVGGASLIKNGGPYYGIDFKGGTVVDVRFAGPPPIDTIRNGLTQQGIVNATIVPVSDISNPNSNEVLINLEEKGQGSEALDAGKSAILNALHATLGSGEAGKQDFNAAGPAAVSDPRLLPLFVIRFTPTILPSSTWKSWGRRLAQNFDAKP